MTTRNPTIVREGSDTVVMTFEALTANDDTSPIGPNHSVYADRSVQIIGTFDTGTVTIEGSNDGTNWATLNDLQGTALSKTSGTPLEAIAELTRYLRAKLTSGGASSDIDVIFVLRKAL